MSILNTASKEILCKLVYCGPAESGKLTTLSSLSAQLYPTITGPLPTFPYKSLDRPQYNGVPVHFFDFKLPDQSIHGFGIRIHIETIHGKADRSLCLEHLKGADGVVFVVDSRRDCFESNVQYMIELDYCRKRFLSSAALVMQWNKRDLPDALPINTLEQYLNRTRLPAFETVASSDQGTLACLRACIDALVQNL